MAEARLICGRCGASNPAGNNYCGRCGVFLGGRSAGAGEGWRPADRPGDPRARAQARLIFGIVLFFVLACVLLSLTVIIWRP